MNILKGIYYLVTDIRGQIVLDLIALLVVIITYQRGEFVDLLFLALAGWAIVTINDITKWRE